MFNPTTFYRKLPHENVWQFCRKRENWPQFGYGEREHTDCCSLTFCLSVSSIIVQTTANGFISNCRRSRCLCQAPE